MNIWDQPDMVHIQRGDGQIVLFRIEDFRAIIPWPVKDSDERTQGCSIVLSLTSGELYDIDFPNQTADDGTCYGMEIAPAYGDVILRRFTAEAGIEPVKITQVAGVTEE